MQRQKTTLRLDPLVVSLGRKLAKTDFGSETKLGILIEHAIKSYNARHLTELEAEGLLSAAERALVERLEKRFDDMGKRTVERVGNLIAKSSYDAAYSAIVLEDLYESTAEDHHTARASLEKHRREASIRLQRRMDREGAEQMASLLAEYEQLREAYNNLLDEHQRADVVEKSVHNDVQEPTSNIDQQWRDAYYKTKEDFEEIELDIKQLSSWTRKLIQYMRENTRNGDRVFEEFLRYNPAPKGL